MPRNLEELFVNIASELIPPQPLRGQAKGLAYNSRNVNEGFIFFALQGSSQDGRAYIEEAVRKGAVAVVTDLGYTQALKVPLVRVREPRRVLGQVARRFFGDPTAKLVTIGITGTNGKTTVSYLVKSILSAAGHQSGLIGTIGHESGGRTVAAKNTTPESLDLFMLFDEMVRNGLTHVVMEISSHALALHRVAEVMLTVGVYTNLTRDHLDFHPTFDDYKKAKLSMLKLVKPDGGVVYNLDDIMAPDIERLFPGPKSGYGLKSAYPHLDQASLIRAEIDAVTKERTSFTLHHGAKSYRIKTTLLGRHNVYNVMASFGAAAALNVNPEAITRGIANLKSVPGRLMPVPNQKGLSVFIDYAHTDDALKSVLTAVREFTRGRVIVVFGCGGNRDRGKRPLMGRIATELADFAFVTSDNPRNEAPEAIINEIVQGVSKNNYQAVPGRRDAICAAIKIAQPQDSVVIAGKGHENYQIVKDEVNHFDDFEVAQQCLS